MIRYGFKTYRKKTTIKAKQMTEDFTVDTLEGRMTGKSGDWLAIGVKGEEYPIQNDIFVQTYELVEPTSLREMELMSALQKMRNCVKESDSAGYADLELKFHHLLNEYLSTALPAGKQ